MNYQSFGTTIINSNSNGKYQSLLLTEEMVKDKTCLDIGCNEGYFCFKLSELGAKEVIGIDKSLNFINQANVRLKAWKNTRETNIIFQQEDWSSLDTVLGSKKFDLILILSAFHYATDSSYFNPDGTNKLLNTIKDLLNDGGCLVWEGGRIDKAPKTGSGWIHVNRVVGAVYHPTKLALEELFAKTFKRFVCVGPSVLQKGDPIPRFVYHCFK